MPRDIDAGLQDAIEAPVVRPLMALHIDLPDPVYVWTGQGTIVFNGATWLGIGAVGAIDTIGESTEGSAVGVQATLYNVPSEFRDDLADQAVRGRLLEMFVGALNETYQQVDGFKLVWKGTLQEYTITDSGETLSVMVGGESRAIDQRRPSIKRFTSEYQQRQYPGDLSLEYVPKVVELSILWAKARQDPL